MLVNIKEALIIGFKTKGLRFYGRSSRAEFWYFYLSTMVFIGVSFKLNAIPVVGSLIQAIVIILIVACQYTATIRRMHDLNMSGKIVAAPYLLTLIYLVALGPVNVLYPEFGPKILDGLVTLTVLSYLYLIFMCAKPGTKGNNRYGTDPLDTTQEAQDFINPSHLESPDLLGDPWAKFKAKVAREKKRKQKSSEEPNDSSTNDSKTTQADADDQKPSDDEQEVEYVSVPTPQRKRKKASKGSNKASKSK